MQIDGQVGLCLDGLPFYVLLVDDEHQILFANQAARDALGCPPGDLVGAYCPTAVHGLAAPFPGCPLEAAVSAGGAAPVERELYDERTGRWGLAGVYPTSLRTPAGRPVFLHFVRDITDEKRTAQDVSRERETQAVLADILALAVTDASLEELLDGVLGRLLSVPWLTVEARGGIFLVEREAGVLVLKAQRDLPQWTRTQCQRVPFGDCVCGRAAETRDLQFASDIDDRHQRGEHTLPPHGHYCIPITARGRVLGVINLYLRSGHQRDPREELFLREVADVLAGIVERRRAEAERARLASAVTQSAEGVIITDADGLITDVNPSAERLLGYSADELLGTLVASPERGYAADLRDRGLEAVVRDGVWHAQLDHRRKDGTPVSLEVTSWPIKDAAGRVTSIVGLVHDRTLEVRLEAQLRQGQRLEALGRLAAGMAHDFKNLLFVIQGYLEQATRTVPEGDPVWPCVAGIRKTVERGSAFTRQLLAFGHQDAPVQPELLDLNAVVRDLQRMLTLLVGPGIEVVLALSERLDPLLMDQARLQQVLVNLVTNAHDAMPGGGRLEIATAEATIAAGHECECHGAGPGRYATLTVSDTGVGMIAEVKERIFEPFFTTKRPGEGTGLGLSTVYGLVKGAGGCIRVSSTPGRGSAFTVFLPFAR